jgi:hypothetical protein
MDRNHLSLWNMQRDMDDIASGVLPSVQTQAERAAWQLKREREAKFKGFSFTTGLGSETQRRR